MSSLRVVAALLERDGLLFAARRSPERREGGLWELPGGKVEAGESDQEALARELQEELSIHVEVGAFVAEATHAYAHGTVTLVGYRCRLVAGEPVLRDHDASRWLSARSIHEVEWAPADLPLLAAWGA
jgi:8-oxo-dGTP diphosphatase